MIKNRLALGQMRRVSRGIYVLPTHRSSWRQSLMILVLLWDGAVISHVAAAALWKLAGFGEGPLEVVAPREKRKRGRHPRGAIVHFVGPLVPPDLARVEGIPVTTVARTLIDLAGVVSRDRLEDALDDALVRRLVTVPQLRRRLDALAKRGRPGIRVMRALLDEREGPAVRQNVFESRLRRLIAGRRLPQPEAQYPIRDGERIIAVADFAYPGARLIIEADGFRWHSSRAKFDNDRDRNNELLVRGWRTLHVTWTAMVRTPDRVADQVALALGMTRLPGCP